MAEALNEQQLLVLARDVYVVIDEAEYYRSELSHKLRQERPWWARLLGLFRRTSMVELQQADTNIAILRGYMQGVQTAVGIEPPVVHLEGKTVRLRTDSPPRT